MRLMDGNPTFLEVGCSILISEMLYTVVMDYRGGTYVAQVNARSVTTALKLWSEGLDTSAIAGLTRDRKKELVDHIMERYPRVEKPVLLNGLANVWCASALTSGGLAIINIVATNSKQPSPSRPDRKGR